MSYPIIDSHTHTYPEAIAERATEALGKFYEFHVDCAGTYADLEAQAKACGVCGFILFAVATNAHQVQKVNDNTAALAALSRSHGMETTGFAGMHQDYPDFEGELRRCEKLGLRGVKIHPDIQRMDLESKEMYRLCEILEGHMPLFLHMGDNRPEYRYSEPKKLVRLLKRFPRLEVVAAHLGGYQAWDEAEACLYGMPNVWYDISSALWAMTPERAYQLMAGCGFDRLFFGTDYPVCSLQRYIDLFLKIDLTEEQRMDIFYRNVKRFLETSYHPL